jgi:2-polyprenyl-3-methyl-5-hydroxy-6-metoxy-1,4-benzoquinol methylase
MVAGDDPFVQHVQGDRIEQDRYRSLKASLHALQSNFAGKRVLDFGASYGLSACVLLELGAASVVGVEPEASRVIRGVGIIAALGLSDRISLRHIEDTRRLDISDESFEAILANAVFEHIPQPRCDYVRELWRVLAPGGALIVSETPNKYLPWDFHTTNLPLLNWLPKPVARTVAVGMGRFRADRDWDHSGWRGMGYYEFVRAIPGPYKMAQEQSRVRHRVFRTLGLPASLLDPYPTYIVRKLG